MMEVEKEEEGKPPVKAMIAKNQNGEIMIAMRTIADTIQHIKRKAR